MVSLMTFDQYRTYMKYVARWNDCTHFGTIISRIDRINDVPNFLEGLEVAELIPYLLINEKTNAFIYKIDLGRKYPIRTVEIYHDTRPRATEWRKPNAEIALRLDEDLVAGLDAGVAVPDFVVPFTNTALAEAMLNR